MKRIVFAALVLALSIGAYGKTISGYVSDAKSSEKLGYATVMLKHHDVGMICDSCGFFKLEIPDKAAGDSVEFRYIGYEPTLISLNAMTKETNVALKQQSKKLKEITVKTPHKFKTMKSGKKHTSGLFLSFLGGINGIDSKGDTYGFESKNGGKRTWLKSVGFFIKQTDNMLSRMKFRINIYDMVNVKKAPSSDLLCVQNEPIFFEYRKEDVADEKYTYNLPKPLLIPDHALVEIEFLENIPSTETISFKSNIMGGNTWYKDEEHHKWDKCPIATPFFVEYIREKK